MPVQRSQYSNAANGMWGIFGIKNSRKLVDDEGVKRENVGMSDVNEQLLEGEADMRALPLDPNHIADVALQTAKKTLGVGAPPRQLRMATLEILSSFHSLLSGTAASSASF